MTNDAEVYAAITAKGLREIGYWKGPYAPKDLPDPRDFVYPEWNRDERDFMIQYLDVGMVARGLMGYSSCRFCGKNNGNLEFTDGVYVWPSGLSHYLEEHQVALPREFIQHAYDMQGVIEEAPRVREHWLKARVDWSGSATGEFDWSIS